MLDHIRIALGELRQRKRLIVDHLQAMRYSKRAVEEEEQIAEVSKNLKYLALELQIPIILLVRLELTSILSDECRDEPKIRDFGQAIIIERYADIIMMISRNDYYHLGENGYKPSRNSQIIITKNNNGPTGLVALDFYWEFARFENIII